MLVAATAGIGGLPGAAYADGSLVSVSPAAGAALNVAPSEVTLRFSARIAVDDSHLAVSTASGGDLADGELAQSGPNELRLRIRASPPGDLAVAYHVIFADGADATGAYRFSVGTGLPPAPLSSAEREVLEKATAQHAHQVDALSAGLLIVDGGVLLVAVFLLLLRRRGRETSGSAWRYRED